MSQTKVSNIMTKNPVMIDPNSTLEEAAKQMEAIDCGILPVGTDTPEGIITDRDIVIRAVARGKDVRNEKVRDYMTAEVCSCAEDALLEEAAAHMRANQVTRLLVKDRSGEVTGILTFGSILRKDRDKEEVSEVVECATGRKAA